MPSVRDLTIADRRGTVGVLASSCTTPADRIRALTGRRRIEPTSPGCRRSRRPEPGRCSTYQAGKPVQTNRASSGEAQMADGSDRAEGVKLTTVVPWLLTLLTAGFGIWQFTTEQAQSNRVPFLTEQLKLAFEASDTAARLATETDAAKWEAARQN